MKARSQEDLIRLYGNPHVDYIMQLETSVAGMEKINYCEVVISTGQEKEDILNILEFDPSMIETALGGGE